MCEHYWVYSNQILCSCPAQVDRICKLCGFKERVYLGKGINYNDTYEGICKKFKKDSEKL